MPKNETTFETIGEALKHAVDQQIVTAKQLASWAGRDVRSVYFWLAGEHDIGCREIRLIGRQCPPELRLLLASALMSEWGVNVSLGDASAAANAAANNMTECLEAQRAVQDLTEMVWTADRDGFRSLAEAQEIEARKMAAIKQIQDVSSKPGTVKTMRMSNAG